MRPVLAAAAFTAALASAAWAQPSPQAVLGGPWTIARTSEWPDACSLILKTSETIGGWDVKLKRGCAKAFKWTADITAWRVGTTPEGVTHELVLQDATRHAVIRFNRGEDEDWVGPGPDGQDYIITRDRPKRVSKRKHR